MLKKFHLLLLLLLGNAVFTPVSASAQSVEGNIGYSISDITYKEPGVMEETGNLFGFTGNIAVHNKWMYRFEIAFSSGYMDYTSEGSGSMSDIPDYMYETRFLFGKDSNLNGARFSPYTGLGYRYLNDDMSGMTSTYNGTTYGGYEREQSYLYLPIGVLIKSPIRGSSWIAEGQIEYDYLIKGWNTSHTTDVSSAYDNDLSFTQDSGYGVRASLSFIKTTSGHAIKGYSITPYLKYWHIDESDIDAQYINGVFDDFYVEPENSSTEYGIIFGLQF